MTTANGNDVVVACMVIRVAGRQRGECRCLASILERATNAVNKIT